MATGCIRIGCSGWQYRHWRGVFYPPDVPQSRWLEHYATVFETVEINNSFYRLPEASVFSAWASRVPRTFTFAVKASRFLTHMKKLKDPEEPLERLLGRARALGRHLGPVLYQLPPGWSVDSARLEAFLRALPKRQRHVIEFRDPSWYTPDVMQLLERYGVSLCLHDMRGSAIGRERVGPLVYVRFHGSSGRYAGAYSTRHLSDWAEWLDTEGRTGVEVYAYFNNDTAGHAPRDAMTLRNLLGAVGG